MSKLWDIDYALDRLIDSKISGTIISRVLVDKSLWESFGLKPKPDSVTDCCLAWSIGLGIINQPKLFVYGMTINEAYQKALKIIDQMPDDERVTYGFRKKYPYV